MCQNRAVIPAANTDSNKRKIENKSQIAFVPDIYEIGMSNLGMRILYGVLNLSDDIWCERVFAPWKDMEEKMRENNIPLAAHESGDPIQDFDFIGFTLQYELCYSNVLNMLDLAGIPLYASERGDNIPCYTRGPARLYARNRWLIFDLCIGEGEEALVRTMPFI